MPMYMDFHELAEFTDETIDQLKQGHKLDLAIQSKYNVQYKHFYISKDNLHAFCVMEGPDKESCEAVHREAHGVVACNIVEVELSKYGLMMGLKQYDLDGMHVHEDGTIDSGMRTILCVNTLVSTSKDRAENIDLSRHFLVYSSEVKETASRYHGRELSTSKSETSYAFTSCMDAIQCGMSLQSRISNLNESFIDEKIRFETTVILNAGEPVTWNTEFFGDTLRLARRLSHMGSDGDIIMSSRVGERAQSSTGKLEGKANVKTTGVEDERFINRIMDVLENRVNHENFNVVELSERAGISRPQLYRRINELFGMPPNHLINEMRLKQAVKLIDKEFGNIAEVAYEAGYNNPSYFTKCFQKRFGILPSAYSMKKIKSPHFPG